MRNIEWGNDYNVYCDESCHLEKDGKKAMSLGAVWCPKGKVPEINKRIQEIKEKISSTIAHRTKTSRYESESTRWNMIAKRHSGM